MSKIVNDHLGFHIGENAGDKVGLFGVTAVVQPAGAAQAALTDSTGGSVSNAICAAVGATNSADQSAVINANFAKILKLLNALQAAGVNLGTIKGSA